MTLPFNSVEHEITCPTLNIFTFAYSPSQITAKKAFSSFSTLKKCADKEHFLDLMQRSGQNWVGESPEDGCHVMNFKTNELGF